MVCSDRALLAGPGAGMGHDDGRGKSRDQSKISLADGGRVRLLTDLCHAHNPDDRALFARTSRCYLSSNAAASSVQKDMSKICSASG